MDAPVAPLPVAERAGTNMVRAVRAYTSRSEGGISFDEGDPVEILQRDDSGWWLGRANGREGLFPSSRVAEDGSAVVVQRSASMVKKRTCVALFDFAGTEVDELPFRTGDVITIVSKSKNTGWWKGRLGDREGIFPANRVEEPKPAAITVTRAQREGGGGEIFGLTLDAASKSPRGSSNKSPRGSAGGSTNPTDMSLSANYAMSVAPPAVVPARPPTLSLDTAAAAPSAAPVVASTQPTPPSSPRPAQPASGTARPSPPSSPRPEGAAKAAPVSPRRNKVAQFFDKLRPMGGSRSDTTVKEMEIAHPFESPAPSPFPARNPSPEPASQVDMLRLLDTDTSDAPPLPSKAGEEGEERRKRHHYILQELVKTEEDYVRDMEMIVELFLVPIRSLGCLNKAESDSVFQNVSRLIPINASLLDKLRQQQALPEPEQRIGKVFLNFSETPMDEYTLYAAQSQQSSQTLLRLAKSNDRWAKFLAETYTNPKLRDLKLDTYLIKPVQRVCRYPLLLKELQRATAPECADAGDLRLAMEKLNLAIGRINETRRENENFMHQVELESGIKGLPVDLKLTEEGRKFVREGRLQLVKGSKKAPRMVWLFTDCLLYAKLGVRSGPFRYKGVVMLHGAQLNASPTVEWTEDEDHVFEVLAADRKSVVVVACSSSIQRDEWFTDVEARIHALQHKKDRLAPLRRSRSATSTRVKDQGVVAMKGARSARVMKLRDAMVLGVDGVELLEDQGDLSKVFSGRAAVDFCVRHFSLKDRAPALELMSGLLASGVMFPVLDTTGESFIDGFTAFYSFGESRKE